MYSYNIGFNFVGGTFGGSILQPEKVFIACVLLLLWSTDTSPQYHLVELFSGVGRIARLYRSSGLNAVEYDFIHSAAMIFSLQLAMRSWPYFRDPDIRVNTRLQGFKL